LPVSSRAPGHVANLVAQAAEHWRAQGSRLTHVRRIVCEQAFASIAPFDAETLLARARTVDRAISLASVYRTLGQLVSVDLLRSVPGTHGERHYSVVDAPAAGMSHIVCIDCNCVLPLPDPCLPLREGALARQHGFKPQSMTLRVEATCEEFRFHGTCTKRPPPSSG
jgi:Fur family transcriptional regulator, ferric uptake regulator